MFAHDRRSRAAQRVLGALVALLLVGGPLADAPPAAAADPPTAIDSLAAQQLADRYAPVVYLRQLNLSVCNTENEGFDPVPVEFVLGRPDIPLLVSENGRPTGPRRTVVESPTAADLFGKTGGYFLDFPGLPVRPGCTYRRYYADRLATEAVPHVAYAHITQPAGSDQLVLQYWMFYYFNDWNNDHEGDWEMVMLFFDATSVEEALTQEPVSVVYAQHGGGERAGWDDDKLSKEDGHPVVYVARGAHASFYEQHVYLGLAEHGTGFGCETTRGPHRRMLLDAVVLPDQASGPDDPFAWLGFTGYWGEFRRSEWSGPTGPNAKTPWRDPIGWADGVRDTSLAVPDFEGFGESPVHLFCGIVSVGSRALIAFTRAPAIGIGALTLVLVALGWVVSYTSHTIRRTFGYYRRHLRTFAIIGAVLLPTGYLVAAAQTFMFQVPPFEPFLNIMQRFPGVRILLALAIGSVQAALAVIFVAPTVIWAMGRIEAGHPPRVAVAYRNALRAIWPIFLARLRIAVRVVLYAITIVGIPWALLWIVRGVFVSQAVIYEGDDPRAAVRDSSQTANMALSRAAFTQLVLTAITILTGPLLAIVLLIAIPSRPLGLVNYVSSILFAFLFPFGVIGMTLLYHELRAGSVAD